VSKHRPPPFYPRLSFSIGLRTTTTLTIICHCRPRPRNPTRRRPPSLDRASSVPAAVVTCFDLCSLSRTGALFVWLVRGAIAGGLGGNPSGLIGGYGGGRRSDVAAISHSGLRSPALPKAARRHRASDLARKAPGASPVACPVHGSPISILQQANQVSFVFNFQFPMSICIFVHSCIPYRLRLLAFGSVSEEAEAHCREAAGMQIRVRCGCGDSSCPEWAVVELQGMVQPQASFSGDIRGLHIGRLCSAPSPSSSKVRYLFLIRWSSLVTCLGGVGP
jgi:hypothetical protein